MSSKIIGIDLGTTNCCGAYFNPFVPKEQALIIFKDEEGEELLPSNLAVKDGQVFVGRKAKKIPGKISSIKRMIENATPLPLKYLDRSDPAGISAEYLKAIKRRAEKTFGEEITRAVITVPAHFNHQQKKATLKAGELANLKVEELLPEPSAAALAYSWEKEVDNVTMLVYDLGGGTFDATILTIQNKVCKIAGYGNGLAGEGRLGGSDFDRHLVELFVKHLLPFDNFQKFYTRSENGIKLNAEIQDVLIRAAEEIKITICKIDENKKGIFKASEVLGKDFNNVPPLEIGLSEFKALIETEINQTVNECKKTFNECKRSKPDLKLDRIIMVGGSSRIPFIKEKLEKEFGIAPDLYNPDLCVAIGAAIYAANLGNIFESSRAKIILEEFPNKIESTIDISGFVELFDVETKDKESLPQYSINLYDEKKDYNQTKKIGEEFWFEFNKVPVPSHQNIKYFISLDSSDGSKPVWGTFLLEQGERIKPEQPRISQPFKIKTIDGMVELLPAGAPLGSFANQKFYTVYKGTEIRIPAYEGHYPLHDVIVSISDKVPTGTPIEVSVGYDQKNQIVLSVENSEYDIRKEELVDLSPLKENEFSLDQKDKLKEQYMEIMKDINEQLEILPHEYQNDYKQEIKYLAAVMDRELRAALSDPNRIMDCYLRLEVLRTFLSIPRPDIKNVQLMTVVLREYLTKAKTRKDLDKHEELISRIEKDIAIFDKKAKEACTTRDIKEYTEAQNQFRVMFSQLQELQPTIDLTPQYYERILEESQKHIEDSIRCFNEILGEQLPKMNEHDRWKITLKQIENNNYKELFNVLKDVISKFYSIKNSEETIQAKTNNLQILLVNKIIPLHKRIIHEIDQKGLLKL